ncbi:MAG: MFS transporter [Caldilineaceae bacterium]|nr:MFS transporter [Caldilineaceae bacterium]
MLVGSYIELLRRNASFRNLWFARVVSNLGDWFNLLASAALITQLTGAGTAISLLFLARFVPLFVMSPFGGVLADRFDRRKILIATDLLRAVTVLGFLLIDRPERIGLLYVLTILQFVFSAVYMPAHQAYVPAVVDRKDLVAANALDSFTWSTMLALGALLGGLATAFLGVQAAFSLDALSFLVSAWFVGRIAISGSVKAAAGRHALVRNGLLEVVDGMRFLWARPAMLAIALAKAGGALIWGSINVLEIPLAENIFPFNGNGSLTLGLIYAGVGIGTGFGPLLLRARLGDHHSVMYKAITIGFMALTLGILGLAVAPSLGWVLAATVTRGLGTGSIWVFSTVLLQVASPDSFRGRVFAFEFAALTLTQSISTLWAGFAYDSLGMSLPQIFFILAIASSGALLVWALFARSRNGRPAVVGD